MNGKIENNFKQTAATLAEALPYIQRYESSTIVIKLGGHAMTSKTSMENFARDIVLIKQCGVNPVIVHGGGPMINRVLTDLKIESQFLHNLMHYIDSSLEFERYNGLLLQIILIQQNYHFGKLNS